MQSLMTVEQLNEFLEQNFPQVNAYGRAYTVENISQNEVCVRLSPRDVHLRPGGTVSGPSLFTLADLGAYAAILAYSGPVALAVTTNLNINFLNKPPPGDLLGKCRIIKMGKRLCVVSVDIISVKSEVLMAQATATYSLPVTH